MKMTGCSGHHVHLRRPNATSSAKAKLPHALQRGIRDSLGQMGTYEIAKYQSRSREWKMRDTLRMVHPVPADAEASEAMRACVAGTLTVPKGWESELSARGNTAEVWNELLAEHRLGFMAQLRNMRNIIQSGASIEPVLRTLCNGQAVRASRQLPFRFYSAWRELAAVDLATTAVTHALDTAMKEACANADRLPGKTAVMIDSSGSMGIPLSARSRVTCRDVAAVLGAMSVHISDDAWVCRFDTNASTLPLTGESVLADVQLVPYAGGCTNMGAAFDLLSRSGFDADRIIVLSDNEVNHGRCTDVIQTQLTYYRKQVGHDVWCHAIDLQGTYTVSTVAVCLNPSSIWEPRIQEISVEISADGETYTEVAAKANYQFDPETGNRIRIDFDSVEAAFVKVIFFKNSASRTGGAQAAEICVY